MAEHIKNNPNADFKKYKSFLENLKSKQKESSENADMKCKNQEKIYNDLSIDFDSRDWERCLNNFEELKNNSKDIRQIIKDQNEISQETLSLTGSILESLENSFKQKVILCYSDWVATLIDEIIVPELGWSAWKKISSAYTRNFCHNDTEEFDYLDEDEEQLFDKLYEILEKVNITIEDFDCLVELNKKRNSEFHINSQPLDEAKKQLEMPFPKDLEDYKEPLKKALDAIETRWNNKSKKPKKRSRKFKKRS